MMKKVFIALSVIAAVSLFLAYKQNDPKLIISKMSKDGLIRGDSLNYVINFLGLPLGAMKLSLNKADRYNEKPVYYLNLEAQTLNLFSKFFKASAVLDSYVDKESLNPLFFKQRLLVSGKDDEYKEISYDQENLIMLSQEGERCILKDTQDPLSALLNFKKMDLSKTKEFSMNLNSNQKNYILKGSVKPQNIEVNGAKHETAVVKAEIFREDNKPYHGANIEAVFLREEENVLLLMNILADGFVIKARLADSV